VRENLFGCFVGLLSSFVAILWIEERLIFGGLQLFNKNKFVKLKKNREIESSNHKETEKLFFGS
jgi:hypothetical protein